MLVFAVATMPVDTCDKVFGLCMANTIDKKGLSVTITEMGEKEYVAGYCSILWISRLVHCKFRR
jgi:hypothetical protein